MNDLFPMKKITIYHKEENEWIRQNKMASVRTSSSIMHENTGVNTKKQAKIRIFDFNGYKITWNCEKRDVIVLVDTKYEIKEAPMTELKREFGEENVFEVSYVQPNIYEEALDHIKIECV